MRRITRRAFLGGSLGAATGMVLPGASRGRDAGRLGRRGPSFELGLASYTFREFDLDATLAMAARLGLGRISLKDMHLPLDSSEEIIRRTVAKVRAYGLVPYGCGVVYMANEAEVDRAFAYAKAGDMELIVGVPDHGLLGRAEARVRETGKGSAVWKAGYAAPQSAATVSKPC